MYWSLLFATCLVVLASAAPDSSRLSLKDPSLHESRLKFHSSIHLEEEWKTFKINYNKAYKDAKEEIRRKKIFAEALEAVEAHNRLYSEGRSTYMMGINPFSDMDISELVSPITGYKPPKQFEDLRPADFFKPAVNVSAPVEVDWRLKGYVTPVKNQAHCGSCWAFSATGTLEGQHFRKTGKLVSLSEQQLVDCLTHGCSGDWPSLALEYIASNGGIDTEESYPYEAKGGPCRYNQSTVGATCKNYSDVPDTESALEIAVATIGPISVTIEVLPSFQKYTVGVYNDPECSRTQPNHAVLVVGYGKSASGEEYWIVKNSWGTGWGMDGYIWMSKNKDNQCGIATNAIYAVV